MGKTNGRHGGKGGEYHGVGDVDEVDVLGDELVELLLLGHPDTGVVLRRLDEPKVSILLRRQRGRGHGSEGNRGVKRHGSKSERLDHDEGGLLGERAWARRRRTGRAARTSTSAFLLLGAPLTPPRYIYVHFHGSVCTTMDAPTVEQGTTRLDQVLALPAIDSGAVAAAARLPACCMRRSVGIPTTLQRSISGADPLFSPCSAPVYPTPGGLPSFLSSTPQSAPTGKAGCAYSVGKTTFPERVRVDQAYN